MTQTLNGVPILVIAFNRPRTLGRQLSRIENLSRRRVILSVDGPRDSSEENSVQAVMGVAEEWARNSKHEFEIFSSNSNLGLHGHFQVAFTNFFEDHTYGLVLEDDIDFNSRFIDFVDSNFTKNKALTSAWSVMGHNPLQEAITTESPLVQFRESKIHTIWGWAASGENVEKFLRLYNSSNRDLLAFKAIDDVAMDITHDIFLRNALRATWKRKISRASQGGGGWDNWWVVAGWGSGLNSLIPNRSLSREELNQTEGQSHQHLTEGVTWDPNLPVEISSYFQPQSNKNDCSLLKVWGIGRRYSWSYAYRISKELGSFANQAR
jgi:hypothetical protein